MTNEEHSVFLSHFQRDISLIHSVAIESVDEDGLILKALHTSQLDQANKQIKDYCRAYQKEYDGENKFEFSNNAIIPTKNPFFPLIFWFDGIFALRSLNNLCVKIYNDDICNLKVDVIVNAINSRTSQYINAAAGQAVTNEVENIIKERGKPFQIGQIYATRGGRLQARNIFHISSLHKMPSVSDDKYYQNVKDTVLSCLNRANKSQKASSIVFPDISSGKTLNKYTSAAYFSELGINFFMYLKLLLVYLL